MIFCSLYQVNVFSKIWRELAFVHYIAKFTITRYTITRFGCIYKNYTFESVILESLQIKVSKCPSSICFDTTEAMLLLNKELKPNMVWGLWPETKCGIFLKNNFFFFLRDSKAQKLFSFLLLYNSVQITHIFFCKKTFSFQSLFTNYKHQAIHQNLYLFKRARKNTFAIR